MSVNKISLICRVMALLILVTVIVHWDIFLVFFHYPLPIGWYALMAIMGLIFIVINIVSAVGLFWEKPWGFTTSYLAIVFSTLFFSACYIPYLTRLFPAQDRTYAMMLVNVIFIIIIASLQYLARSKKPTTF